VGKACTYEQRRIQACFKRGAFSLLDSLWCNGMRVVQLLAGGILASKVKAYFADLSFSDIRAL